MVNLNEKVINKEFILRVKRSSLARMPQRTIDNRFLRNVIKTVKSNSFQKGKTALYPPTNHLQNSIVKISYATNQYDNQWLAHGKYMQRDGVQHENKEVLGFNAENAQIDIAPILDKWQKEGDPHIFKMIVSPEQSQGLDLKEHAKQLIGQVENDLGTRLDWIAIDHYNTDNPHIHIVVRGKDLEGNELIIDKNYIKNGVRLRSKEVATQQLGFRLKTDIIERRNKYINDLRITEMDRDLDRLIVNNHVELKFEQSTYQNTKQYQLVHRLKYLETLNLAKHKGGFKWEVADNLISALKAYQETNDIIKRRNQHQEKVLDKNLPFTVTKLNEGERLLGRVVAFGVSNDLTQKRYMLVEGFDGRVHYIEPGKQILKKRDSFNIKNGYLVYLEGRVMEKKEADGKITKIQYTYSESFSDHKQIVKKESLDDIDSYFLELRKKHGIFPKNTQAVNTVRGMFLSTMDYRIKELKALGYVNNDLTIVQTKLQKGRSRDLKQTEFNHE